MVVDESAPDAVQYAVLTKESIAAFADYSEEEYRKWWGIRGADKTPTRPNDDVLVSVNSGIIHFSDIVQLIDDNENSFQDDPLCCPFSLLLPFCVPVLTLHLHGYPPEASEDVIRTLLRLFASIYWVHKNKQDCLCYVNAEAAYSLVMELHAREVNGFRLVLSL